jgi:hypothetical protein
MSMRGYVRGVAMIRLGQYLLEHRPAPPIESTAAAVGICAVARLQVLDRRLADALEKSVIRLVSADALRAEDNDGTNAFLERIVRRQDLEELERTSGVSYFLSPSEAVAALTGGTYRSSSTSGTEPGDVPVARRLRLSESTRRVRKVGALS